jgi:hypothetical protein
MSESGEGDGRMISMGFRREFIWMHECPKMDEGFLKKAASWLL